ncbi:hypothetical protein Vretimale_9482 [Volvox reticuliferus]|uniref:Uncharacterized protein n=1 Tax=Volvox reticuliferus TaxID=1737510 RepID=A0A8J4GDE9_9CHLO|nr:hypothetical protein Vretifemale_18727 [Volvox reticuliferus]GIM05021.1 hypothetical protein Vretimale_9482 [Volvox reticuliferus]
MACVCLGPGLGALGASADCIIAGFGNPFVCTLITVVVGTRHNLFASSAHLAELCVQAALRRQGYQCGLHRRIFSMFQSDTPSSYASIFSQPRERDVNGSHSGRTSSVALQVLDGGFATFLVPVPGPTPGPVSGSGAGTGNDVEAGWSRANVPLVPLTGTSGRCGTTAAASASAAGPSSPIEVNTMMAVALSGDMRTHMQALRAQSIRSLTKQLLPLPQLVPSVAANGSGGNSIFAQPASFSAINTRASSLSLTHPLSPTAAVAGGGPAAGGFGLAVAPAAAALGYHCELRDLCDAVLTDVGSSAAVKRQAAALKEALGAMELLPRGPAELAGRQL